MTTRGATAALADFAATLDSDVLPDEVRTKLGLLLLDYLRVCSVGARMPWGGWARTYVATIAKPGGARALFSLDTLNAQHAAFLNTAYGSSFDGDDTHVGAMLHPGVAAWSASLAVAQERGASGRETLAAVVAGYETAIRLGLSLQPGHFKRGFQSTGTCSGFGAAAAAGRLLFGGDAKRIGDTLGLMGGMAGGVAQFYFTGGSAKRIHAAQAAGSGVAAGLLAQAGFAGPAAIIEGEGGFARAYSDTFDPVAITDGLGTRFHLLDVLMKSHAAAARVAAGIDAMVSLRAQHDFAAGDIESMTLGIPAIIQGRLTHPHPVDLQAAQMSLPFTVAVAASVPFAADALPVLSVEDFATRLGNKVVGAVQDVTTIELDDAVEQASNALSTAARVTVTLRDGRTLSELVPAPLGSPSRPFSVEQVEQRFAQELSLRIPAAACDEIVAMARNLDRLDPARLGTLLAHEQAMRVAALRELPLAR